MHKVPSKRALHVCVCVCVCVFVCVCSEEDINILEVDSEKKSELTGKKWTHNLLKDISFNYQGVFVSNEHITYYISLLCIGN